MPAASPRSRTAARARVPAAGAAPARAAGPTATAPPPQQSGAPADTLLDTPADTQLLPLGVSMTSGKTLRLDAYAGRTLVLYFYPKDNTPGCTTEAIQFRDAYPQFLAANADIVGISRDSLRSHEAFKARLELPFELASDPDEQWCQRFGVIKQKLMYGKRVRGIERSTFVIDAHGRLVKEWRGVKVLGHVPQILDFVKAMA